jgi:hypothetical protein
MFLGLREDLLQKKDITMISKTNNMPAERSSGSGLALAGCGSRVARVFLV